MWLIDRDEGTGRRRSGSLVQRGGNAKCSVVASQCGEFSIEAPEEKKEATMVLRVRGKGDAAVVCFSGYIIV
jgi:hypothetical protein